MLTRSILAFCLALLTCAPCPTVAATIDERPAVFVQLGHTSGVWALALSPDGRTLAGGDIAGNVKLWDALTRQELLTFPAAGSAVIALAFARDGSRLYAGQVNGTLRVLDVASGRVLDARPIVTAGHEVLALTVSADGTRLAVGGGDAVARILSLPDLNPTAELRGFQGGVYTAAFTPDGARLVAGDAGALRVWDIAARKEIFSIPAKERVSALALSADGNQAVAGFGRFMFDSNDRALRIYDLTTRRETGTLTGHRGPVSAVRYSPDGTLIAASTSHVINVFGELAAGRAADDVVRVWRLADGKLIHELRGHSGLVTGLEWSADGRTLYSSAWDNTLRAWALPSGESAVLAGRGTTPALLLPGASAQSLNVVDGDGRISAWDLDSGQLQSLASPVRPVEFVPPTVHAARSSADATRMIVGVDSGQLQFVVAPHNGNEPTRLELKSDPAWAGAETSVRLRAGAPDGERARIIGLFNAAALNANGSRAYVAVNFIASGNLLRQLSRIVVWNTATNAVERVLPFEIGGEVTALAVSGDERLVLYARRERTAETLLAPRRHVSELRTLDGALRWQAAAPTERDTSIDALAFSTDSARALVGNQHLGQLIDTQSGSVVQTFAGHRSAITAAAFSADGALALTGDASHRVAVWNTATGAPLAALDGHSGIIKAVGFVGDGTLIASAAQDQTLRLWRWPSKEAVSVSALFHGGDWVTLTPEGFFAGSPAGAEQLGFRYGGKLYPLNQFYDAFYRPDLVRRKLRGESLADLAPALLEDALRTPPPEVRVAPIADSAQARVRASYEIASAGGGIGEIRVYHNGKLLRADGARPLPAPPELPATLAELTPGAVTRGITLLASNERESRAKPPPTRPDRMSESLEIAPLPGVNELSVIAFNRDNSVQSRLHSVRFVSTRAAEPPRIFVLAVGINRFRGGAARDQLRYAARDAQDFSAFLAQRAQRLPAGALQPIRRLTDAEATRGGILRALDDIAKQARPQDTLILFFASHGVFHNGNYAIVTHDYAGVVNAENTIAAPELIEAGRRIAAQHQLLVLDTCHAGGLDFALSDLYDSRITLLARNVGLHAFASAGTLQQALDGFEGNGLFTHALLRGLRTGEADGNRDKTVTVFELGDYARKSVPALAGKVGHRQTPVVITFGKDVPLVAGY